MRAAVGSRPSVNDRPMSTVAPPSPSPPKRRRERLGLFVVITLACLIVVAGLILPEYGGARRIVAREDAALEALLSVQAAELELHASSGRYGFVRALADAGLLGDLDVTESDGVAWVRTDGYRVEVLLPHGRLGPGTVGIVPEGSENAVDADLATRHFSVVARPLEPGVSGYRMWYVDQRGEVYLNEGVIDDASAALNDLPTTQVLKNASLDTASFLLWQKASGVPPVQD